MLMRYLKKIFGSAPKSPVQKRELIASKTDADPSRNKLKSKEAFLAGVKDLDGKAARNVSSV